MSGLMIIAAVLVIVTMAVAIFTARELETLKTRLTKLEELRDEIYNRLNEAREYRQSIEGTRDMLKGLVRARLEQHKSLKTELEQLKKEVVEERQISVSDSLHSSSDEEV